MYTLYIANKNYSSWSLRPWVLMRTLGIPFEEKINAFDGDTNWERFRAFSPTGRVPALHDGDTVVWDSLAITEYLAERHATVWPHESSARAFARCAAAEMHSGFATLREHCSMNCGLRVRLHRIDAALQRDLDRLQELWAQGLQRFGGPFLAGQTFTAVDAFFAPVALRALTYGLPLNAQAQRYVDHLLALPAMREWYDAGLAEVWRDPGHDDEISRYGQITADLRQRG